MMPAIRQTLLYLTLLGTQGCWLYVLISLANRHGVQGQVSVIGLIILYPVSFLFNLFLERLGWHRAIRVTLSWLAWLAAMLLMVRALVFPGLPLSDAAWAKAVPEAIAAIFEGFSPVLLVLLATALLWWLGRRRARAKPGFESTLAEFQFGLAIMVIVFFVASQLNVNLPEAIPAALAFFVFALVGISLAHAGEGSGWLSGSRRGSWSAVLVITILLAVGLGWAIGSALNADILNHVLDGLKLLWGLIIKALIFIASLLPKPEPGAMPTPTPLPGGGPVEETFDPFNLSEEARNRIQLGWTVLMAGLLAFVLWRVSSQIIGWLRRRLAGLSDAEVEPMKGAFREDIKALLRLIFRVLLSLPRRLARRPLPAAPEVLTVRHVYRQLLRWAAARGYPRARAQTPYEYLEHLAAAVPQASGDLAFVTEKYVRARYSPVPPGAGELRELRERWQTLKKVRIRKPENERSQDAGT